MIITGDCLNILPTFDADSVDAVVTDPPYGLTANKKGGSGEASLNLNSPAGRSRVTTGGGFMGKQWDHGVPGIAFWQAALRVAKPGAHLLAFGGTRTHHRLMCAIEDAGWAIRDCMMFLYGSGFPKSLDVSKAIDKAAGAEREKISASGGLHNNRNLNDDGWSKIGSDTPEMDGRDPVTDAARQWSGWGTALKPAWEPIIMARKPLIGTVAANVERYGTGGINVEGCRLSADGLHEVVQGAQDSWGLRKENGKYEVPSGRFPTNLLLDEDAAAMLDQQSGDLGVSSNRGGIALKESSGYGGGWADRDLRGTAFGDSGGASRFFYVAKASRSEREEGCENLPPRTGAAAVDRQEGTAALNSPRTGAGRTASKVRNHHPTVKPLALMRYLCRLITPPRGLVLDPFCGSGSTGCAAAELGFRFIGVESDEEYAEIARARFVASSRQALLFRHEECPQGETSDQTRRPTNG